MFDGFMLVLFPNFGSVTFCLDSTAEFASGNFEEVTLFTALLKDEGDEEELSLGCCWTCCVFEGSLSFTFRALSAIVVMDVDEVGPRTF